MGDGVVSLAVKSGEPVIVTDAWVDTRIAASQEDIRREGYRSLLAIPLITKRGALGAACLYTMAPGRFVTEDIQILFAFTNEAALALENANLYEEVRQGLQTKSTLLAEMHHRRQEQSADDRRAALAAAAPSAGARRTQRAGGERFAHSEYRRHP